MYNSKSPAPEELPSKEKLIKSTVIAAVSAAVILATVVLPAEYGIDPTGIGNVLGLKKMGEIKLSLAKEAAEEKSKNDDSESKDKSTENADTAQNHVVTISLAPNEGKEIKLKMDKGKTASYKWESSGGKVNFDIHGDSKSLNIKYHNYSKGSSILSEGIITADFDGYHGWFWRNRTGKSVDVTLTTSGEYQELVRIN